MGHWAEFFCVISVDNEDGFRQFSMIGNSGNHEADQEKRNIHFH